MNRRDLLKGLAVAPLALTRAGTLLAAPGADVKLLLVFLRGGYDCANVLVPVSSDFYYESRPNIAIARPGADASAALALDADWGLHPALRESLLPLYEARQLAFVPFAGTDDLSRSHFETQDSIELGQPAGARDFSSGFLNRLATELRGTPAMSFTDQLPLVFRGEATVPNMALRNLAKPAVDARQAAAIQSMWRGTRLAASVDEGFAVRDEVLRDMAGEMQAASRDAITPRGFELEARRIARLMRERFSLGFVDVGGWDTHVGEGGATGFLATRLEELGRALATFAQEMDGAWQRTVVVVVSEFGRTFRENGNRGTDHGHGSVYMVAGGAVRGGRIAGEQLRVTRENLFQDRDYRVLNDYRALLAGLFARLYGLDAARIARVFPQATPRDLALA
ncbi:MAG TPA: DUF1501 domain-containing protein [Usitatibacter sp.]|nr:DUF1501 domain-containing protein [Usitatibacter sp.]